MPSQVPMELPLSLPPGQGGFDDCWETLTPEEDKKEATECDAHSSQEEAFWGPALHAEPGAHGVAPEPTARAAGSSDNPLETVTPEEDKKKLRNATLTPARKKLSGGLHYMPSQVPMELPLSLPPGRLQVLTTPWRR